MKKVFIHVGLPKTATTFLQERIFVSINNLLPLMKPYTQSSKALNKLQYADDCYYNPDEFKNEIEAMQAEKILISDEALCGATLLAQNTINRSLVAKRFAQIFPEAEIILFLRGQSSFLLSMYYQSIKMGSGAPIKKYIWYPQQEYTFQDYQQDLRLNKFRHNNLARYYNTLYQNIHLDDLYYYELIKLYKDNFKKTHVFLYEDFSKNSQDVIHQLEDIVGCKVNNLGDILSQGKVNVKFDKAKLERTRALNKVRSIIKTKNKYILHGAGLFYRLITNDFQESKDFEEQYIAKITKDFYTKNNQKIVKEYPDVGIQYYPDKYQLE